MRRECREDVFLLLAYIVFAFFASLRGLREKPVLRMPWQGNRLSSLCLTLFGYSYKPWSGSVASRPPVRLNTRTKTPPSTRP